MANVRHNTPESAMNPVGYGAVGLKVSFHGHRADAVGCDFFTIVVSSATSIYGLSLDSFYPHQYSFFSFRLNRMER
jgi:hypothetical protein